MLTPLEVLGQTSYPAIRHYMWPKRVFTKERLGVFAADFCAKLPSDSLLSFEGSVGARKGPIPLSHDDVCEAGAGDG
ncbi:MAG: hypothetical protein AAGE80_02170 [Pseudomonadota bacterium]